MNPLDKESENTTSFPPVYDRYCRQIDKEDELVNQRVNWLLSSQSILFAAIGLTGHDAVSQVVPWVGLGSSLAIGMSVWAAVRSLNRYREVLLEKLQPEMDLLWHYPQLHRKHGNLRLGNISAIAIPLLFCVAWITVMRPIWQ
jgi:hypothetical protein